MNIHSAWGFVEKCSFPLLLVGGETEFILISNELGNPAGGVVSLLDNFFLSGGKHFHIGHWELVKKKEMEHHSNIL